MSLSAPVTHLQPFLTKIFGNVNQKRTWDYMYGYLSRNTGYLVRRVNTNTIEVQDFIRPIAWLYAIAEKLEINLDDAILSRFPSVCPYCIVAPCDCLNTQKSPSPRSDVEGRAGYQVRQALEVKLTILKNTGASTDLDSTASRLSHIYPNNAVIWKFAGPYFHFTKLHEELAELHEAVSHYYSARKKKTAIEEEIADVAAWILGMWPLLFPKKSIHHEIVNYYSSGCPVCLNETCACGERRDRANGTIDLETLAAIKAELIELEKTLPGTEAGHVAELKHSLDAAIDSGSELDAEQALKGIGKFMQKTQSALATAGNTADAALGAYQKISGLINTVSPIVKSFFG